MASPCFRVEATRLRGALRPSYSLITDAYPLVQTRRGSVAIYGSFDHVLQTREWTPLQPGFSERKYYVRGVGPLGNPNDIALADVKHR